MPERNRPLYRGQQGGVFIDRRVFLDELFEDYNGLAKGALGLFLAVQVREEETDPVVVAGQVGPDGANGILRLADVGGQVENGVLRVDDRFIEIAGLLVVGSASVGWPAS